MPNIEGRASLCVRNRHRLVDKSDLIKRDTQVWEKCVLKKRQNKGTKGGRGCYSVTEKRVVGLEKNYLIDNCIFRCMVTWWGLLYMYLELLYYFDIDSLNSYNPPPLHPTNFVWGGYNNSLHENLLARRPRLPEFLPGE